MNFITKVTTLLFALTTLLVSSIDAQIQEDKLSTEEQIEQLAASVADLQAQLDEKKSAKSGAGFYTPTVYGTIFSTFAVSTYDGATRFNVRNSRLGIKGNAVKDLSYVMQIDFHNQGSLTVLDAFVRYTRSNFDVTLGQQHIHLSTELDRGPNNYITNSRSYSSILSTSYYDLDEVGNHTTGNFGSRDIGAYANYYFRGNVPVTISAGAYNGLGVNKQTWSPRTNFVTRLMIGSASEGLYGGGSFYWGDTIFGQNINIITTELSYKRGNLFMEGLYQQRRLQNDGLQLMQFGFIQGYYKIKTDKSRLLSHIAPTFRWDCGDNMEYMNTLSDDIERLNVHRFTPQVNFAIKGEKVRSHIAISYEKILMNDTPFDISSNPLMHDKFTMAFVAAF